MITKYSFSAGTQTFSDCWAIIHSILKGENLQDGGWIKKFETAFADYIGTKHAFSFAAGRMGLYCVLEALNIGEGDEIILPAYTCVVVPNALIYKKVKPVYVDIDQQTLNIDVSKIEEKITSKTKAVIAQHSFGLPCDMDKIIEIARKHKLYVIEDACLALGAEYIGKKAGNLGDVAFFSLDNTKVISTEIGGMVTTNNKNIAEKIKKTQENILFFSKWQILRIIFQYILSTITYHPQMYFIGRYMNSIFFRSPLCFLLRDENMLDKPQQYAYPARLSNIQARIGLNQLKNIDVNINHRIKLAEEYKKILSSYNVKFVNEPSNKDDYKHIYLRYTVLVEDPLTWRNTITNLHKLGDWFNSIAHGRTDNLELIGYKSGSCPVAEYMVKYNINFPTHLRIKNVNKILNVRREL